MPTPLEDHGGPVPGPFHTRWLPDSHNKVVLFYYTDSMNQNVLTWFQHLRLDRVLKAFVVLNQEPKEPLHPIHPLVEFIKPVAHDTILNMILQKLNIGHCWVVHCYGENPVHPAFWSLLESAKKGTTYCFTDEHGTEHKLVSWSASGASKEEVQTGRIAAYFQFNSDPLRNGIYLSQDLVTQTKASVPELVVDTTQSFTPLCHLATKYRTDKSAYNPFHHRHPYTAVYDMMFRPYTTKPFCKVGEVGVLNGSSIRMWADYFPTADIVGFDITEVAIKSIEGLDRVTGVLVDAAKPNALRYALSTACKDKRKFTILIEDASHWLEHQLMFLRDAIDFVEPGGLLVIEDIFRDIPLARFEETLSQVSDRVLNAIMVRPEHAFRCSPQWENDRILFVWVR